MNNTELNQTQSIGGTDTPQSAATNIGASDATPFQQSAPADALRQNKEITVVPNGEPLTGTTSSSGMSGTAVAFIVISSIVLVMVASTVFSWIMKKPEPTKAKKSPKVGVVKETSVEKIEEPKKTKKKKKLPRSKRHK